MNDGKGLKKPIKTEVEGAPVEAHGFIVTPYAQVWGEAAADDGPNFVWRYAWARIRPSRITVLDRAGRALDVRLVSKEWRFLAAMAVVGAVIAAWSILVSLLAGRQR